MSCNLRILGFVLASSTPLLAAPGCSGNGSGGGGTGSAGSTSTSNSTGTSTTMQPSTGATTTTTAGTGTTTAGPGSETSAGGSTTGGGSSSGTGCAPGTVGCPCDAGACQGTLVCQQNVCVDQAACTDNPEGEPNDTEAQAVDLGDAACGMVMQVMGAVDMNDVDWFKYHGIDDTICSDKTTAILDDDTLPICMYFVCDQGNAQVQCMGSGTMSMSPGGNPGCCDTGSVIFNSNACLGAAENDSGTVYIEVSGPADPACVDYSLAYRFF